MTEDEMMEKKCPKSYDIELGGFQLNCLGSECAWWVWETHDMQGQTYDVMTKDGKQGHCGLIKS
jgi:hypothetical protein